MLENQTTQQPPFAQSNGDKVAAIHALINATANHAHCLLTGDSVESLHEGGKGGA